MVLTDIRVRAHYEHPMSRWQIAVRIDDPWHPGDYFLYRLPEVLRLDDQEYICQYKSPEIFPTVQPEAAPEWEIDDKEKSTQYKIRFYDGIEFAVTALVIEGAIEFLYVIHNGTSRAVRPSTGSCFMLWTAPRFIDRRHDRTFVWADGESIPVRKLTPTPEQKEKWSWAYAAVGVPRDRIDGKHLWSVNEVLDHGLICVKDRSGNGSLGLAWAEAKNVMARSTIPCLHSEPEYPEIESGQSVQTAGRLYFSEGGIEEILERHISDLKDEALSTVVWS